MTVPFFNPNDAVDALGLSDVSADNASASPFQRSLRRRCSRRARRWRP